MWFLTVLQKVKQRRRNIVRAIVVYYAGTEEVNGVYRSAGKFSANGVTYPRWKHVTNDIYFGWDPALTAFHFFSTDGATEYYISPGVTPPDYSREALLDLGWWAGASEDDVGVSPFPIITYLGDAVPEEAAETPLRVMVVTGAGSAAANGRYIQDDANPFLYVEEGGEVVLKRQGVWYIGDPTLGVVVYYISGAGQDQATPDLVETWELNSGDTPLPVVTEENG